MTNIFFISDTHFSHDNICKFVDNEGNKLRPFENANEMDEVLIKNWNNGVNKNDKVYHLGDVAIPRRGLDVLNKLNGDKVLIRGNHDIFKLKDYLKHFRDIRGAFVMDNIIFTHIPVHPDSKARFKANVHGHLHSNKVRYDNGKGEIDSFYVNVSVEQINFTPIHYDELKKLIK